MNGGPEKCDPDLSSAHDDDKLRSSSFYDLSSLLYAFYGSQGRPFGMTVSRLEQMRTKGFNENRSGAVSDGGLEVRDMGNS